MLTRRISPESLPIIQVKVCRSITETNKMFLEGKAYFYFGFIIQRGALPHSGVKT
jgi:hypothetical protein